MGTVPAGGGRRRPHRILPLGGAAALLYIAVKSILGFSGASLWSMVGIAVLGIAAMLIAAFVYRSPFFLLRRVAYRPEGGAPTPLSR